MAQKASEIKVASEGGIYVAPYSGELVLPEDAETAIDAAFNELGYASDDGVTATKSEEVEEVNVWQSQNAVRRITTSRDFAAALSLAQWNRDTVSTALGGGTWTEPKEGTFRFDPPDDADPLAEWAVVVEAIDGERIDRWVLKKSNVTGELETQMVRNGPQLLPVTFSALTPDGEKTAWYYLTNDEAMEEGS